MGDCLRPPMLVTGFTLTATPALAEHFNRAAFIPSFEPCDPALANTATSNGVPACTPAVPTSNCVTDLDTALVVGAKGGGAITYRQSGRRETQNAGSVTAELTTGRMLDKSGNIALISPASLVRCNQHTTAAGTPFCFSN